METSETIRPDKHPAANPGFSRMRIGRVVSLEEGAGDFVFVCENANVWVQFTTPWILRVKLFFDAKPNPSTTVAVLGQNHGQSRVVVRDGDDEVTLDSAGLSVVVNKNPFSLKTLRRDGTTCFETVELQFDGKGQFLCLARAAEDSHFYGLGEKTSFLDKRGERYEMWNTDVYAPHVPEIEALYISIPYLVHQQNHAVYGVFLDNPGKTVFDMRNHKGAYGFAGETGNLDFYVIHGDTLKEVTKNYTGLTGRMQLPPKWALGYHQSRYSYMNQAEVLELAQTFRNKEIPCDAIYLDIHYMDGYRVFTFDKTRFPDPKLMMEELSQLGFHVVPIVDPGVKQDPLYPVYREGAEEGYFCKRPDGDLFIGEVWPGQSAFPDFTQEEVARWWGRKLAFYVENGIKGIWNDMNEPAVFNELKTLEPDVMHENNGDPKTHAELHNLYGMLMSKATYLGLKEHLGDERPFVLTRAGYAGIQRYAAVWTGDNRSFWDHMQMAIPMVLNLGLSGVAFAGPDIGGFAHHTSGELLARWTQMGALFPFSRNHSALDTVRQEPWSFGPEVEKICRDYIELRYRWMPFLYSLFFEAAQSGLPVMRPLLLEYPDDAQTANLSDQFLLGEGVLAAPVYRPDSRHRAVYLPEGTWYHYWTGERYQGRQHILVEAPLDTLPLFIRAGTILPEGPVVPFAKPTRDPLTIHIYAGNQGTSRFRLYDDDGLTFDYQHQVYSLVQFEVHEEDHHLQIGYHFDQRGYDTDTHQEWIFTVHFLRFRPTSVNPLPQAENPGFALAPIDWGYDETTRELKIRYQPTEESGGWVIS